jgi:hypothetical protein
MARPLRSSSQLLDHEDTARQPRDMGMQTPSGDELVSLAL